MFDTKLKVLVVDDMMTMRKIIMNAIKNLGFNDMVDAVDGAKAWEILTSSYPPIGLIISDWNMPNMTGLELLKKVRADEKLKNLPFVLVTAESNKTQVVEAIKAGVTNYVVKPFTPKVLAQKLEEAHKRWAANAG